MRAPHVFDVGRLSTQWAILLKAHSRQKNLFSFSRDCVIVASVSFLATSGEDLCVALFEFKMIPAKFYRDELDIL